MQLLVSILESAKKSSHGGKIGNVRLANVIPYYPQIPPFNSVDLPTEHGSTFLLDPVLVWLLQYFPREHEFNSLFKLKDI